VTLPSLEEMEARIRGMSPEQRKQLAGLAHKQLARCWNPQPGPQTDAYKTTAEQTLYGGAAGGGKSDLLLGLAVNEHRRTVIFRRQSKDLEKLWQRLTLQIAKGRVMKSNSTLKQATLADGRFIEFGHLEAPGSEQGWQGNDHDLYGFDEAAQLDEHKVNFVIQWLRSTIQGQRARIVFATNPPVPEYDGAGNLVDASTGAWLMDWFAPWLSDTYASPATPGEIRWCFMRRDGDRLTTVWVDGPGGYNPETGERIAEYTEEDVLAGLVAVAVSRTFIRSRLENNAFLKNTGYAQRLASTPEPLKSLLLTGSFTVKGEDHPFQVIPTQWVLEAQERGRARRLAGEQRKLRQLVLSGDIAQGGADSTVLADLYETDFFGDLLVQPGNKTPTGFEVEALVLTKRRNRSMIVLDGGGGWAGSTRDLLWDHQKIAVEMCRSGDRCSDWDKSLTWKFWNIRTKMWWGFREALDPQSNFQICLPDSTRLLTQLTTPHFKVEGKDMTIEAKEDIRKRLNGASTDEADAVIQAWLYRDDALAQRFRAQPDIVQRLVHGTTPEQYEEQLNMAVEIDDPLGGYR
jgi:hypothetical protein